ncbi:MAG TPA: hypothetical protein VIM73_16170 [Polyangiaceae bacterium]
MHPVREIRRVAVLVGAALFCAAPVPAKHTEQRAKREDSPVVAKPPPWTQTQKSSKERGENPCNTPDPGFGMFERWSREPSMGQMIVPKRRRAVHDVMFHFHGHEPARKEWVRVMDRTVLVGIDLGLGSGPYEAAFRSPAAFRTLLESVERALAKRGARIGRIGLSAWSAGYGAIQNILAAPENQKRVDIVVLLDGLHCGYTGRSLNEGQLGPFLEFSRRAAAGRKLMVVTHSSIIPPGYASTTETANYLVHKLGGRPVRARARKSDPLGLELISRFSRGAFHVRGFAGNDTLDHCAHVGLYRDVLKVHVRPRWSDGGAR